MRVSVWYRDEEKRPARSGWYLAHRGFGMGGMGEGGRELGNLYYNAKKNRWQMYDYDDDRYEVSTVYYWTDADTDDWIDEDGPSYKIRDQAENPHPAIQEAWLAVEDALEQYRVISELAR